MSRRSIPKRTVEKVLRAWSNGVDTKTITKRYGVTQPTVSRWVKNYLLYYTGTDPEIIVRHSKIND